MSTRKAFRKSMNSKGPKQQQVVHTKQASITSINIVPERLVQRVWRTKLPSQRFPVLAHTYSLALRSDCTKLIRYVTLQLRDQRDAASLRQGISPKSLFLCSYCSYFVDIKSAGLLLHVRARTTTPQNWPAKAAKTLREYRYSSDTSS